MKSILLPFRAITLLLLSLSLYACASTPAPVGSVAKAETAVEQAREAKADEHAPLLLRSASQKADDARAAMKRKDYTQARRLAEEAQIDAELAQQTALSARAQQAASELRNSLELLRRELGLPAPQ